MRAISIVSVDGPSAVQLTEVDEREPGPDEVLIEVRAAGVTFPDVLMSRGSYQRKPELPFVPGSEVAGTVLRAGAASGFSEGARVSALPMIGGFAERATVHRDMVFALPESLDFHAGAVAPVNYLTAHFALTRRGRLRAGDTILVHGAGGGLGSACVQLGAALGARVIAVVSSEAKAEAARAAGAHEVVAADGFLSTVKQLTARRGVDVVLDPVGGERFTDSLRALSGEGRVVVLGFVGGDIPVVKVNRLLLHNTEVIGAAWGEFAGLHAGYAQHQWAELTPLFASGALRPVLGPLLPLAEAARALTLLDTRAAVGNVALAP